MIQIRNNFSEFFRAYYFRYFQRLFTKIRGWCSLIDYTWLKSEKHFSNFLRSQMWFFAIFAIFCDLLKMLRVFKPHRLQIRIQHIQFFVCAGDICEDETQQDNAMYIQGVSRRLQILEDSRGGCHENVLFWHAEPMLPYITYQI